MKGKFNFPTDRGRRDLKFPVGRIRIGCQGNTVNGKNCKFKGLEVKPLCIEIDVLYDIYNIPLVPKFTLSRTDKLILIKSDITCVEGIRLKKLKSCKLHSPLFSKNQYHDTFNPFSVLKFKTLATLNCPEK